MSDCNLAWECVLKKTGEKKGRIYVYIHMRLAVLGYELLEFGGEIPP
jgi:hypothetical protein